MNNITNPDLKVYKEEYDRLIKERKRLDLLMDAVLTSSALKLDTIYNKNRLDYAHLSNAYSAFASGDKESMQFSIVDTTIRDLFFTDWEGFEFVTIEPYEIGAYEFIYKHKNTDKIISIKIPTASRITKDNIDKLEWGVITVYENIKRTDMATEKIIVIQSDDIDAVKVAIRSYLAPKDSAVEDN